MLGNPPSQILQGSSFQNNPLAPNSVICTEWDTAQTEVPLSPGSGKALSFRDCMSLPPSRNHEEDFSHAVAAALGLKEKLSRTDFHHRLNPMPNLTSDVTTDPTNFPQNPPSTFRSLSRDSNQGSRVKDKLALQRLAELLDGMRKNKKPRPPPPDFRREISMRPPPPSLSYAYYSASDSPPAFSSEKEEMRTNKNRGITDARRVGGLAVAKVALSDILKSVVKKALVDFLRNLFLG